MNRHINGIEAVGFPSDLDRHPLLAWMGDDWVEFVTRELLGQFRQQDAGTRMLRIVCEGTPQLETRVREGSGAVTGVALGLALQIVLRDSSERQWRLRGIGAFRPDATSFQIASTERVDAHEELALGAESLLRTTFACEACGEQAGAVELRGAAAQGEVRRETFTGTLTQPVAAEAFDRLRAALGAGDAASLFSLDPELAPFYCPTCGASYCADHWDRWDVFDEDMPDWHDSIRGRCPKGHERMLED